jgi:hypothetical protein
VFDNARTDVTRPIVPQRFLPRMLAPVSLGAFLWPSSRTARWPDRAEGGISTTGGKLRAGLLTRLDEGTTWPSFARDGRFPTETIRLSPGSRMMGRSP